MKKILFLILFCSSACFLKAQSDFEQLVSARDLGFSDGDISAVSRLDDRFTFFVVVDNLNKAHPYVLDNQDNSVIATGNIEGVVYYNYADMVGMGNLPVRAYKDGKLYFSGTTENDSSEQFFLVMYDLIQLEAKTFEINHGGNGLITLAENNGRSYVALVGSRYQVYELKENELELLLDYEYKWRNAIQLLYTNPLPVYGAGKFFIAEQDKILAYDVSTDILDTLIEFDYSTEMPQTDVVTFQNIVHNDKVYFVYKNAQYNNDVFWLNAFEGYVDETVVIESDGTKEGTKDIFRYDAGPLNEAAAIPNLPGGLFFLNQKLYWMQTSNTVKTMSVYEVRNGAFEFIDTLYLKDEDPAGYPLLYTNSYPLYFSHLNYSAYKINDVDYFLINTVYGDSTVLLGNFYWNLWTVEDGEIRYLLKDYPVGIIHQYPEGNSQKMEQAISGRIIGAQNDSLFLYTFSMVEDAVTKVPELYKVTVSVIDLNQQTKANLDSMTHKDRTLNYLIQNLTSNGTGIYFTFFEDTEEGEAKFSLWKYDLKQPVSVKNNTAAKNLLSLYPNPASQSIAIQSEDLLKGDFMIVGADGKIYQSFRINGYQQQVDVSSLANGIYIMVYHGNDQRSNQRFIIMR